MSRSLLLLPLCVHLALACSDASSPAAHGSGGGASGAANGGTAGATAGGAPAQSGGSAGAGGASGGGGTSGSSAGTGGASSGGSAGAAVAPLFSDGFDGPSIDATKWTERIVSGGSFSLDSAQKRSGASSLRVAHTGFSTMLAAESGPVFPAPDNTFFGRVWLYVPGTLPESQHVVWIEAGDVDNDQHEVRIGMNLGALQVNLYHDGEVDLRAPDAPITANEWHCVEFKMGNDELEIWLDDARIDELSTTTWVPASPENGSTQEPRTSWSPQYEALRIGWELSGAEIYYDDVALGHSRVGCN